MFGYFTAALLLAAQLSSVSGASPVVEDASFSGDGSSVIIQFVSATNRGGYSSSFICSELLSFPNVASATCQWSDDSTVVVFPGSQGTITVSDSLNFISGNKILSKTNGDTEVSTAAVNLHPPVDSVLPTISLSVPASVSSCSPINFDLSQTYGSGGREWLSVSISAYENGQVNSAIQSFLNSEIDHLSLAPIVIESDLLTAGSQYSFQVTLCNFLASCSNVQQTTAVTLGTAPVLSVKINGGSVVTETSKALGPLSTTLTTLNCGNVPITDLTYTWEITGDNDNNIVNAVADPTKFKTDAFSLTPESEYTVKVTVTALANSEIITSSHEINVEVEKGDIVAVLAGGGSTQSVRIFETISVDASGSYDADVEDGDSSSFEFQWYCSGSCDGWPESFDDWTSKSVVTYTIPDSSLDGTAQIYVKVKDGSRESTSSVASFAMAGVDAPAVAIVTGSSALTSVNTQKKLIIAGSVQATQLDCDAVWTCSDSSIDFDLASGVSSTVPALSNKALSLLLPASLLPARSSLTFTLTCGTSSSSALVTTNGPPLPGAFGVNPSTGGIEITTSFLLSASGWSDSAADYPLSYTFGFNDANGAFKAFKAATLATYISTSMSATTTVAVVRVADIHAAYGTLTAAVQVTALETVAAQNEAVGNLLAAAGSVDDTNNAVSVGSAVLNTAACANEEECTNKKSTRENLVAGLVDNSAAEDTNTETISARSDLLAAVTGESTEVSETAATSILSVSASVTSGANQIDDFEYENALGALDAVDTAATILLAPGSRRRLSAGGAAATTESVLQVVSGFNKLVRKQIVTGQKIDVIKNNFRSSAAVSNTGEVSLDTPVNSGESSKGGATVKSANGAPVAASLVNTAKSSYGSIGDKFDGSAMEISMDSEGTITFNMPHDGEFTLIDPALLTFNATCFGGNDATSHTFDCIGDGSQVTVTCNPDDGPGTLTAYCPQFLPTCSLIVDGEALATEDCVYTDFTSTYTTCECTMTAERRRRGRKLVSEEVEESGVMNVVSISQYLGQEWRNTFNQADDLTSLSALRKVLIVIIMFSVMWAGGLGLLFFCWFRRRHMQGANLSAQAKLERRMQSAQISRSPAAVRAYLVEYISEIFPSVFGDKPVTSRLVDEIKRHHRYLTLFTAEPGSKGDTKRLLTGLEMLSVQTMLMFLLAMLYDLQGPDDDGSCTTHLTESKCLDRKSLFDNDLDYCKWTDSSQLCEYQTPSMNLNVMIIIAVLVALFTAVFQRPIDMIFELLSSPTADTIKANAKENQSALAEAGRRVSSMARRVSVAAGNVAKKIENKVRQNSSVGAAVREIPESTEAAYGLARASMDVIHAKSQQQLQTNHLIRYQSFINSNRGPETFVSVTGRANDAESSHSSNSDNSSRSSNSDKNSDDSDESEKEDEVQSAAAAATSGKRSASSAYDIASTSGAVRKQKSAFDELKVEIACQRKVLRSAEMEDFDAQWGVDPTGEFVHADNSVLDVLCMRRKLGAEEQIRQELAFVEKMTAEKVEKLSVATDSHAGLEILHLFVKDLLGRETAAARIFEIKSDEDFRHTTVVTVTAKRRAILVLVLLNVFFVYYSMLKGYAKGLDWQRTYLVACIVQFVIEIVLFETMECIYINFLVPALVSNDVRHAGDSINDIITQLCSTTPIDAKYFLNVPDYLFVSTNVAKHHPELMESIIVRSYHSHVPGEIAKKWHMGSIARIERHENMRHAGALAGVLYFMQYIATTPFMFQRMMIRFVQPFFLTGIITLYQAAATNTLSITLTVVLIVLLVGLLIANHFRNKNKKNSTERPVTPVRTADNNKATNDHVSSDFADNSNLHLPNDTSGVQIELANQEEAGSSYGSSNSMKSGDDNAGQMVEAN